MPNKMSSIIRQRIQMIPGLTSAKDWISSFNPSKNGKSEWSSNYKNWLQNSLNLSVFLFFGFASISFFLSKKYGHTFSSYRDLLLLEWHSFLDLKILSIAGSPNLSISICTLLLRTPSSISVNNSSLQDMKWKSKDTIPF